MRLEEQNTIQRGDFMGLTIIKNISKYNHNVGSISRIKYIVIHYVGAISSAKANADYFAAQNRNASAHYFVGHNGEIYQSVEDKDVAWHCGGSTYKHKECRNANSIGIELCCRTSGNPSKADENWYFTDETIAAAIELTKELMKKYNIPVGNIIRHYDVTGKTCPAPFVYNNQKWTWDKFKVALQDAPAQNEVKKEESNASIIWKMLINAGYTKIAASALLGNWEAESGLKPNNLQNSYEKKLGKNDSQYSDAVSKGSYTKDQFVKDSAGYGLAQWTYHTRKRAMYEYIIEQKKKRIDDLTEQVNFALCELKTSYKSLITKLNNAKTVKEASDLVLTQYERPADQSESVKKYRASLSQKHYDSFS